VRQYQQGKEVECSHLAPPQQHGAGEQGQPGRGIEPTAAFDREPGPPNSTMPHRARTIAMIARSLEVLPIAAVSLSSPVVMGRQERTRICTHLSLNSANFFGSDLLHGTLSDTPKIFLGRFEFLVPSNHPPRAQRNYYGVRTVKIQL
jgi:hypothetical protein